MATVQAEGLTLDAVPTTLEVKQILGTGYIWLHQINPNDCFTVTTSESEPAADLVGGANMKKFTLVRGQGHDCTLSMALARPWEWKGFDVQGLAIDETTGIYSYVIPVRN